MEKSEKSIQKDVKKSESPKTEILKLFHILVFMLVDNDLANIECENVFENDPDGFTFDYYRLLTKM